MPLITASNLTKFYDTNLIIDHISFAIDNRERLGFIGANGTGKTTLCRILMREESCEDDSIIHFARGMTVGYLSQDMDFGSANTPWEAVMSCFPQMQRIETRLSQLEHQMGETQDVHQRENMLEAHAKLQTEYEALGGFTYHHRAAATLTGLGVAEAAFGRELSSFSGGEQRRVALARLLLMQPDLLLLDEPTNHLDIRGIEWLEYYLKNYSGAVIAISHDRWFLDAVAQRIIELENQTLNEYRGGYSAYVQQKEQRVLTYERQFERQQDEMKRQMSFIRWALGTGQAKKVTAAKSRLKLLDKIDYLDPPASQKRKMSIRFEPRVRGGDEVLELKKVSKSFGDRRLFSGIDMFVKRGQRVGIVGPNGSGKTTLLNIMLGLEEASAGEVRLGRSVEVGYHRQEEYGLNPDRTVYHEFKSVIPDAEETEVRSLLARFLFVEDDVFKPVSVLSGGEQSRLSLAKLMMTRPTLLVLDEPTNHLDIDSRSALEAALLEYQGTLIVVSHDRFFLNNVVNRVLVLENGTARMHEGNYSSYTAKLKAAAEVVEQAEAEEREAQKKLRYHEARLAREEKKKHGGKATQKKSTVTIEALEERAAYLEGQLQKLRELLGLSETYDNLPRASALEGEYHKVSTELEQVYEQWEAAELAKEAKQAARLL